MPGSRTLSRIPSVASLLANEGVRNLLSRHPRAVVVGAIRRILDDFRREASRMSGAAGPTREKWTDRLVSRLPAEVAAASEIPIRRVINATGIVIHTNLGRAPLPEEALAAVCDTARGYANLEFDLVRGERSKRLALVEGTIRSLTGAEAAHVVNNNAAAVLLCLAGLARGREVVVSRGELIEIGGSFRIPDIMAESGARLVEVGTTNRTRVEDYERAIGADTALILKVHRSNFRIVGFTEEASSRDLATLGERRGIPVMEDLGSGALFDFGAAGLPGAPTVRQALSQGPGIVTASGDKLLGGPQAGIIVGRKELVEPLKRHPLSRALRLDKLRLAALAATLALYADEVQAASRIPVLRMLLASEETVRTRARRLVRLARSARRSGPGADAGADALVLSVASAQSSPGGGAMPEVSIPTACVSVSRPGLDPAVLEERLRTGRPPVVGRLFQGKLLLDMRTVGDGELPELAAALRAASTGAVPK